jgi:ABC-2 type transport system ATP-binding protein
MKAGEQAMYLAQLKGLDRNTAYQRLRKKFLQYDILDWWSKPVEELSKGMQQKLQFITTILHKPSFLILDEPFSGFDPINSNLLKEEILQLKQEGTSIILSTHNMASVEEICDEIALINKARKILDGNIFDVKNRFKKNVFEVTLSAENPALENSSESEFELLERKSLPYGVSYSVKLSEGKSSNDLVSSCMKYGNLLSFKEILPTMNEIFIEQVQTFNQQNHE